MAAFFYVGEKVPFVGLVSNPSLNGARGTIVGDLDYESRGRFAANLQGPTTAAIAHPNGISLSPKILIKIIECARPGCDQVGTKCCSVCTKEFYNIQHLSLSDSLGNILRGIHPIREMMVIASVVRM
jgi:hypothetical protein